MKTKLTACCVLVILAGAAHAQTQPVPSAAQDCDASQLTLTTDSGNGEFDGMSHGGSRLVIRNTSTTACRLQRMPTVTMNGSGSDAAEVTVVPANNPFRGPIVNGKPMPMGHGPVVLPIVLKPGAQADSTLRWVSGEVYDHSVCVDVTSVSIATAGGHVVAPLAAHLCGPDAQHVQATATRFNAEPAGKS